MRFGSEHGEGERGARASIFLPPCPPQQPAFCQKRNAIRATIRRAGAVRGLPRSSIWCARSTRITGANRWRFDARARLVIVGLAPGMHGANASGRPFTGDYAGILLYETLHAFGWANQPHGAAVGDGLTLRDCRVTNAVKCLPPQNKPLPVEVANCNSYLTADLALLPRGAAVLALGRIAHDAALRRFARSRGITRSRTEPGIVWTRLGSRCSTVTCSRYNTNTRRLTPEMFRAVFNGHRRAPRARQGPAPVEGHQRRAAEPAPAPSFDASDS